MSSHNNQPTPPSSTSSNGASPDPHQFRVVRKRNRIPLSCAPCRHRKLKCNRQHPCDNCSKRGDTASCSYAAPGGRKKGGGSASSNAAAAANATPGDMQNRIDRLEGLVLSLMTNGSQAGGTAAAQAAIDASRNNSLSTTTTGTSDLRLDMSGADVIIEEGEDGGEESEVEQVSKGIGIMKVHDGRAVFASDAHWYAILGEISEVKNWFVQHKEDYKQHMEKVQAAKNDESPGTAFLLQGPPATDKQTLLNSFPAKVDADRLIARYFNAYDPSIHVVHGPSFQKQYDRHWLNPGDTSVVWLGMCYAMMTLSLQSYQRAGDEPPEYRGRATDLSHEFRRLTAQCLILADITQPIAQILETMVLHVQAEYGRSRDAEPGVLLMVSLCVRLAMRMGYHRDPGPHPQITPFQGEMRRRVWTFVRQCDLLISFQFGLPAMIRTDHIDCLPPRNLYDDELYEEMKELPPSRPSFEATPMSYMIVKSHMTFLFGRIVERTASISNPPSYDEIMKFDQELREARASHPPLLQMRSFQESARDPANLIMQRIGLEMVYLRSLFVLHRKFIAMGRENPRYAYSRRTCIDGSLELLALQATLHQESQPGGRLRSVKWYISSLTTHDFLLAAMLVCLDLYHTAEAERKGLSKHHSPPTSASDSPGSSFYDDQRQEEMLRAVEHCLTIWESVRENSMEAFKASAVMRVMIDKLKAHREQQRYARQLPGAQREAAELLRSFPRRGHPTFGAFANGGFSDVNADDDLPPEQSAAMTLNMLSSGSMSPAALPPSQQQQQMNGGGFGAEAKTGMFSGGGGGSSGVTGLLNEAMAERSGLTPNYASPDVGGAVSPFSSLFGTAGNFTGMGGAGGDIDWGVWDDYIANNTAMDRGGSGMWGMNLDFPNDAAAGGGRSPNAPLGVHAANTGVFMGAATPGANGNGM